MLDAAAGRILAIAGKSSAETIFILHYLRTIVGESEGILAFGSAIPHIVN